MKSSFILNGSCHQHSSGTWKFVLNLIVIIALSISSYAQIYEPDGLRMPGDWNAWANTTGMGGSFDLQKVNTGTARWITSFQYTGTTGVNTFKFASTGSGDPWKNQWAGNSSMTLNALNNVTYGTPVNTNNSITVTQNKWYTVVFEDKGYANTRTIFMETAAQPVNISNVAQNPAMPSANEAVQVSATVSATPSSNEKFYLRYTINGWTSSSLVSMTLSGTTISGSIPGQAAQTTVSYYIFSSVITNPAGDYDLYSLKINNNSGSNYSYTAGETVQCGDHQTLISTDPTMPQDDDAVVIYFNAEYGNLGLLNYTGDVYAHTGVITNLSSGPSDWKYVKTNWGVNTAETKLTRISTNLYSLTIPNIRTYYGVPAGETIEDLAFVFRSGVKVNGAYLEHKTADGGDIFSPVFPNVLSVKILNPSSDAPLLSPNTVVPVCVESIASTQLKLYMDTQLLGETTGSSIAYALTTQSVATGGHWLKAIATGNAGQVRDSVYIYLRGDVVVQALPAGVKNGINYVDAGTVTLVLNDPAAQKQFAFAIGDFSNWLPTDANYMKRTADGKNYWVTLTGLQSGQEYAYQYYIDGELKVADAYCEKILDPWNDKYISDTTYPDLKEYPTGKTTGVVSVLQTNQPAYNWQVPNFTPAAVNGTQQDLVIYELLLRDFTKTSSLTEATTKLDYLKSLGVNAIELMPVMEFDGNSSWGYNPNFWMAPDKYYGTSVMYKQFIDECHERGIAVILDIVANHSYGLNPMVKMYFSGNAPAANNPWFNQSSPHPYGIGYDYNHESPYTRQFFKDVLSFWLTNYKVDGFRFDMSKGLTQKNTGSDLNAWSAYDQSRIDILTDYYNHIKSVNANAYMILEHLADNSEEKVLSNTGMMPWGSMYDEYKQVGMGYQPSSDISWAYFANRGWTYPNMVDYMETHDEERMMFNNFSYGAAAGSYNIKDTVTSLGHLQQAAVLSMGIPGPKMIWQFGELGYDYSILYNGDRTAPKPVRWDYRNRAERMELYSVYAAIAKLRKCDAFRYGTFTSDLGGQGKRMWISHSSNKIVIGANIGVTSITMAPGFPNTGTWYDYFTGESIQVNDAAGYTVNFGPGEYKVYTSVQLQVPFYKIDVTVTDSASGAAIGSATVTISGQEPYLTNSSGKISLFPEPGSYNLSASKTGYKPYSGSLSVSGNQQLSIKLAKSSGTGFGDQPEAFGLLLYPNPVSDRLRIETEQKLGLNCYDMQGRLVMQHTMQQAVEEINLTSLRPGIYTLRFSDGKNAVIRKIVKK